MKIKSFYILVVLIPFFFGSCKKNTLPPSHEIRSLSSDSVQWVFNHNGKNYPATVPGTIHTDLMENKIIKDPFFGTNEQAVQWVSGRVWTYTTTFDAGNCNKYENATLVFDGLDTYAEVYLNGNPLHHTEGSHVTNNMFRQWRFPLPKKLKEKGNTLVVKFLPSVPKEEAFAKKLPYKLPDNRVFTRKAPYQSGWDWGPKLITAGMWKKVYIDLWNKFAIDKIVIKQTELTKKRGVLEVNTTIQSTVEGNVDLNFYMDDRHVHSKKIKLKKGENVVSESIKLRNPEFWWPAGMGKQKRYQVKVTAQNDKITDTKESFWGFRTIQLIQKKDEIGESFEFEVNGVPVFMKGANWIPLHSFPVENKFNKKYRELLQASKDANMNMIRVWGGGIYEHDVFYDICDELGLMVWQDFMFACALYPGDPAFVDNVSKEAEYQIQRIQNHPCIALWCGNNEVKNGWEDWGWKDSYTNEQQTEIDQNLKFLFNKLLPNIVAKYDNRSYHPSSPSYGWGHPESFTEGDAHYWGVWWGEEPFEVWGPKTGRFMSEYGFQAYPEISTIEKFTDPKDRFLLSAAMKNHQKHPRGVQIIKKAMKQYACIKDSLQDFVYISQLVQAYGIGEAIEKHRMKRPHCMGTLYWQLNDCWPVASWSSIDYYGNWKALHYKVREKFNPTIIATDKKDHQTYDIYIVTDFLKNMEGTLVIEELSYRGDVIKSEQKSVVANSNSSTLVYTFHCKPEDDDANLLKIQFLDKKGKIVAQKIEIYDMTIIPNEAQNFQYKVVPKGKSYEISFQTDFFIRGIMISTAPHIMGKFSDNYFDLLPNEIKTILFTPSKESTQGVNFDFKFYNNYFGIPNVLDK